MDNKITFEPYIDKKSDLKSICDICGYRNYVWNINNHCVCKDCLTDEEKIEIINAIENILSDSVKSIDL